MLGAVGEGGVVGRCWGFGEIAVTEAFLEFGGVGKAAAAKTQGEDETQKIQNSEEQRVGKSGRMPGAFADGEAEEADHKLGGGDEADGGEDQQVAAVADGGAALAGELQDTQAAEFVLFHLSGEIVGGFVEDDGLAAVGTARELSERKLGVEVSLAGGTGKGHVALV